MAERRGRIRWPDGAYVSYTPSRPGLTVGIGGNYYWNPGSPNAPSVTVTGILGKGRDVGKTSLGSLGAFNAGVTYLRDGMTSADTLGPGTTSNVTTILPSVTVNSSYPLENGIPRPDQTKVSSIEAGLSGSIGASTAGTYTVTPQEIANFIAKHLITPAMGPEDELSPFARNLRSGIGTVGPSSVPPVGYLPSSERIPLGNGMGGWSPSGVGRRSALPASAENGVYRSANGTNADQSRPSVFDRGAMPTPFASRAALNAPRGLPAMLAEAGALDPSNPEAPPADGLPDLIQEYLRNSRMRDY